MNLNLDKETLKQFESQMVDTWVNNLKSEYIKRGYQPKFGTVTSSSQQISVGSKNLIIIKATITNTLKALMVWGIKNNELRRVNCSRAGSLDIPIESGACAKEIKRSLGVILKNKT